MREIPPKIATLLKSRSMIGINKPISSVTVGASNVLIASGINTKVFKGSEPIGWIVEQFDDSLWANADIKSNAYWLSISGANPIWHTIVGTNEICLFRHNFNLESLPGTVNITYNHDNDLLGLYINGNLIASHIYGGDYEPYYGNAYTVDISAYLQAGDNVIAAKVKNFLAVAMFQFALSIHDINAVNLKPKSINISRNKNMASSLNLTFDNKDGVLSPDGTANQNLLFPNTTIETYQGYGDELIQTFSGLIDRIEMTTFPQELKLSVRDKLKLALDQTISGDNTHTLVYENQSIEAIFTDLCTKAGLTTGTIEATGLSITKTFSWETYADCFSFLSDLTGFEFGADETGLIYFRKDTTPLVPTIAYEFKEGEDIISLGYTIDDNDIYSKVVVYGKDENDNVLFAQKEYVSKDYYNVLPQKFMKIDVSEASAVEQLQAIADRAEILMRSRVREISFACIAVPWLQVGDVIRVTESSTTISELYRVTDLSTNMDSSGYTMQINCYHHSA